MWTNKIINPENLPEKLICRKCKKETIFKYYYLKPTHIKKYLRFKGVYTECEHSITYTFNLSVDIFSWVLHHHYNRPKKGKRVYKSEPRVKPVSNIFKR